MDLEKLLADIERYKRDRKKFTIEIEHVSDACLEAMNSVFNTAPIEEVDVFLDIVYEGIKADIEEKVFDRDMTKEDPKKFYDFSTREMFVERIPPFLDILRSKDARDSYLAVVSAAGDVKRLVSGDALCYLNLLMRGRYRKMYIDVLQRFHRLLPPAAERHRDISGNRGDPRFPETSVLKYLEVLADRRCREDYFEVLESAPEECRRLLADTVLPHLRRLAEYKEPLMMLLTRPGGVAMRAAAYNPETAEQFIDKTVREAYFWVFAQIESMTDGETERTGLLYSWLVMYARKLSVAGNAVKFLRFAERLRAKYTKTWPSFATVALKNIDSLEEESELPFTMIEEGEKIARRFDQSEYFVQGILEAAITHRDILEDEQKRRVYLSAVSRVAECAPGSMLNWFPRFFAKDCLDFLDMLSDSRSIDDLVYVLKKSKKHHPKTAYAPTYDGRRVAESIIKAAPKFLKTLQDEKKRKILQDVVFNRGRNVSAPHVWASLLESVAENPEALADVRRRMIYMQLVHQAGSGAGQCKTLLDNIDVLEDDKKRVTYIEIMADLPEIYRTAEVSGAIIQELGLFGDRKKLDAFKRFLKSLQREVPTDESWIPATRRAADWVPTINGAIKYVGGLDASSLENWLDKITTSISNAPPDIERWLRVGLECVKKYGSSAERYFDYKFKEGSLECKIDELSAVELMLQGSVRYENTTFGAARVMHAPTEEREKAALGTTSRLVKFLRETDKIHGAGDAERKNNRKRNVKALFPDLARFVDPLSDVEGALFSGQPEQEKEKKGGIGFHDMQRIVAREILDSRGNPTIDVDLMLGGVESHDGSPSRAYPNLPAAGFVTYPQKSLLFGSTPAQLKQHGAINILEDKVRERIASASPGEKQGSVDSLLKEVLTVPFASALLKEIKTRLDMAGEGLGGVGDYVSAMMMKLTPPPLFDEVRLEQDACFLDDLIDRTASCISTTGAWREATLIYKLGARDEKYKSTEILELNAYSNSHYVTSIGKVLLVYVKDREDGKKRKLLVEGVIGGDELNFTFSSDNQRFNWEALVFEGIVEYAKKQGIRQVIFNAEHSQAQQYTHDFVRYAAEQVNEHNQKNKRKKRVEYDFPELEGVRAFRLRGEIKDKDGFAHTHHLTRIEPRRSDINQVKRDDWNGECYFDSWYAWHGDNVWNNGTGYIKGFELELPPRQTPIHPQHRAFESPGRSRETLLLGSKGANLASLVGRYEKRRGSGKRGQRR